MPTHGIGSINSPIVISDDEDEINIIELLQPESTGNTNDRDRVPATVETRDGDVRNGANDHGVLNMDHQQRIRELSDRVEPVPVVLKRKRDEGCAGPNFSGPGITTTISDVYPRPESKKARKRRRRLERMEAQLLMEREQMKNAEYMSRQRQQQQRPPHLLAQMPPLQPWGAWSQYNPNPHAQGLARRPTNHLNVMTQGVPAHQSVGKRNMTSSMAHSQSSSLLPSKPASMETAPVYPVASMGQLRFQQKTTAPVQVQQPILKTHPNPTRKATLIGVPHDTNPNSPHGFFTSTKTQPNGEPYVPNPSRTLVMEQLPKNYRKRDVVRSWCKSVCGIFPVHAEVNAKGRALIEFPSAEMARRAFMSPQDVFGKSTVRVWWYREGIPGVKKGEIEDGEIDESENQGNEKPVLVSNAKKKKAQQSLKKWELKQKNLNRETGLATRPAVGSSSGGGMTQLNVQSLPSLPLTHNVVHTTPGVNSMSRPSAGQHPPGGHRGSDKGQGFDDSGYAAEQDYSDDASIASSRAGSAVVEPVTPKGDNESFSEDMDVETPVINRRSSDVFNGHRGHANRRQHTNPRQEAGISDQHGVSYSPVPKTSREFQPAPSNSDSTPQESSNDSSSPAMSSAGPLKGSSEPRPVPTGPSYAKRKDLEERIRLERTKAVDRDHARATSSEIATTPTPASSGTVTPIVPAQAEVVDKVAIEDNLRRLVLESKRNKGHGSVAGVSLPPTSDSVSQPPSDATSNGSLIPATSVPSTTSVTEKFTTLNPAEVTAPSQNALDDLAVSFITEAIQTIKSPSPVHLKPSQLTMLELAAKQQKLEKQIAESKILMAQLRSARTKEEKDRILAVMREQSRLIEADARPTSTAVAENKNVDSQTTKDCVHRWPETREDAGILMISDDEDDM